MTITWKEFKNQMKKAGVKDKDKIVHIEVLFIENGIKIVKVEDGWQII